MKNHNRPFINYEEIEPPQKQKEKVESQNTSIPFIDIDELRPQEKKEKVNPQSFFLNIDDIRPRTAQSEPVKRDLDPKRVLETGDYGDGGLDIMTFGAAKKEKKPTPQEEWKIPDFFSNNGSSNKTEISDESTKENAGIVQAPDGAQDVTKPESSVDDDSQLDVQHGEAPSIDKQEVSTNPSANEAFASNNSEPLPENGQEKNANDEIITPPEGFRNVKEAAKRLKESPDVEPSSNVEVVVSEEGKNMVKNAAKNIDTAQKPKEHVGGTSSRRSDESYNATPTEKKTLFSKDEVDAGEEDTDEVEKQAENTNASSPESSDSNRPKSKEEIEAIMNNLSYSEIVDLLYNRPSDETREIIKLLSNRLNQS